MRRKMVYVIIIFLGAVTLIDTDSYYVPYLFTMFLATICVYSNDDTKYLGGGIECFIIKTSSVLFALVIVMANYPMWMTRDLTGVSFGVLYKIVLFSLLGLSGYCAAYNILIYSTDRLKTFNWKENTYNVSPIVFLCISFTLISVLNIILFFCCRYPGVITADSADQINQLMTGTYSNHHPFYHTIIIKFFITIGLRMFNDMNKAVAFYCIFQILFMSMCFSIVIYTLCQMRMSLKIIFPVMMWYAFMPYHIIYSFTVWKDVSFGGFITLFTLYLYRVLKSVGNYKIIDYLVLFISGLGVCLFRSNGFFVFVCVVVFFILLFWKKEKKICIVFIMTLLLSFSMKRGILNSLDIKQPDTIEALSIPAQQIARVIVEHNDFTEEQKELLNQVVNVEEIPNIYVNWLSNPVKNLVRESNNQQFIIDNKFSFLKLYVQIGLKHPITYLKAWIDQTKGFWNAGYNYWRWADEVYENDYGLQRIVYSENINKYLNNYLWLFSENRVLQLFLSIGFFGWVVLFLLVMSIIRKDKSGFVILIPTLAVILSLYIATPVYAEFRYAYSMFCTIPFLALVIFHRSEIESG